VSLIQKLYRIERLMKDATPEDRHAYRPEHAQPVLDELREWLDRSLPVCGEFLIYRIDPAVIADLPDRH
jgi:hypothetical protein